MSAMSRISLGRGTALVAVTAALALAACVTLVGEADAMVRGCGPHGMPTSGIGAILSVRNMSCRGAATYYERHHGDQHVPIAKGQRTRIGRFRCHVYQDLTPPGPSDTWVRIRCVKGGQAFRLEYGV